MINLHPSIIRNKILDILELIAPHINLTKVDIQGNLPDEFKINELDFALLVSRIEAAFDIEIPESDYGRINSISRLLNYIEKRI